MIHSGHRPQICDLSDRKIVHMRPSGPQISKFLKFQEFQNSEISDLKFPEIYFQNLVGIRADSENSEISVQLRQSWSTGSLKSRSLYSRAGGNFFRKFSKFNRFKIYRFLYRLYRLISISEKFFSELSKKFRLRMCTKIGPGQVLKCTLIKRSPARQKLLFLANQDYRQLPYVLILRSQSMYYFTLQSTFRMYYFLVQNGHFWV